MVGPIRLMICQWTQRFGATSMMMDLVTILEVHLPMHVHKRRVHQRRTATVVSMLMVMVTQHRQRIGASTVVRMHSQAIRLNGAISMRTVLVTITGTLHGRIGQKTGLESLLMGPKIKTLVRCNQEPVGVTASSDVRIPTVMVGGMCKMPSRQKRHNTRMLMVMVSVTIKAE